MGIQMMGSHGNEQQSHQLQPSLARQNSWFNLTLDEVENQLGSLGKPLGSLNLDELVNSLTGGIDVENVSSAVRAFSGKTVKEVWKDIQQGQKMKNVGEMERKSTLGETTLEDFLVKAGVFGEPDNNALTFMPQIGLLSPSPSIDTQSDTPISGRKRGGVDVEKTLERKLRRKIKNRESAARSRARKQAYHNELVSKVSQLEEENMKLKKEKEMDTLLAALDSSSETRYQLRRTTSF